MLGTRIAVVVTVMALAGVGAQGGRSPSPQKATAADGAGAYTTGKYRNLFVEAGR